MTRHKIIGLLTISSVMILFLLFYTTHVVRREKQGQTTTARTAAGAGTGQTLVAKIAFEERWDVPQVINTAVSEPNDAARHINARFLSANGHNEFELYKTAGRTTKVQDPEGFGCSILPNPLDRCVDLCLCDGGSTWKTDPITLAKTFIGGQSYATMAWCPQHSSIDLATQTLTIVWSACLRQEIRRWMDIAILPRSAFIANNEWRSFGNTPSSDHNALMLSCMPGDWKAFQFDASARPQVSRFSGGDYLLGRSPRTQASMRCLSWTDVQTDAAYRDDPIFNGTDNDVRYGAMHAIKVVLSSTRVKVYEQNILKIDWTFPKPLIWGSDIQVMFLLQFYHSQNAYGEALRIKPTPTYWTTDHKYSDARPWGPLTMTQEGMY